MGTRHNVVRDQPKKKLDPDANLKKELKDYIKRLVDSNKLIEAKEALDFLMVV